MVAIVSGNSLGLSLSSLATLGQRGQLGTAGQGRSGEQSFVNIANGNLVLQGRDDVLMGRGLDVQAVRTYNSQGLLSDDNGDNWSVGAFGQKVVLTSGTAGEAGSTLTRTDRDGAEAVYTWDAVRSRYVSPDGAGAFDTIAYDSGASQFVWTDGETGRIERYQSSGAGRLVSVTDTDGNTISYAYNGNGTVQSVTDANGDVSYYDYSGTNLTQIRTVSGGVTTTTVHYAYDNRDRLFRVTVDLSPDDNSVSGNDVYVTTYTYDGNSQRVASVTQSDGTALSFTYVQVGGTYKVATVTDALGGITRFGYDSAQNSTTVTDPLGAQSVYLYDAQGQLLQVRSGVTAGNANGLSQISYAYDALGNVTLVTDGEGHKVALQYDDHGNLTREVDSAGDTRVRTYNGADQLLTDTIYADAAVGDRGAFNKDAALPETTRYVYAAGNANRLRFAITPQGNVTEYRYDAYGQRVRVIEYAGTPYDTTTLAITDVPTEAQLNTWAAGRDLTRTELTELVYDARGQLSSSTIYASIAASGSGVASTAATTQYIYDQRGLLLQKIEPATTAGGPTAVTTYTYDGLGRVLSVSAPSLDGGATPNTTITSYDDTNGKTSVTIASGLVTVSAYDKAGRLVSVTQQSAGTGVLGATIYAYDKDGNLLMTQDPTGVRKWMLYDETGRKIADIDATGAVIEYVYNANGQLRETIAYATPISTANLVDGTGKPTTAWSATNTTTSLAALRPAGAAQDQKVWRFYDTANRLTWQVDALGYVTHTTYDGASRILSVTQLANPIDVSQLGNGANIELLVDPATVGGITLGVSAGPSPLGSAVTLTATIDGTNPGGMVTFFSGDTVIGSAMVLNGKATLVTNELPVGVNSIQAAYSGDVQRPASISSIAQKTITGATTIAEIGFAPGYFSISIDPFEPTKLFVTLTTTQPAGLAAATGEVRFYNGSTLLGSSSAVNGIAMLEVDNLPTGYLTIRAEYVGDAVHAVAVVEREITVGQFPSPTATTLQVSGNGTGLSLAATVRPTSKGWPVVVPGGMVTFYSGTIAVGTAPLINGVASIQIASPESAAAFEAVYEGDTTFSSSSTRGQYGETVPSPTATTLSTSATNVTQGDPVTLTAQVAGALPGGLVTFFAGTTFLGSASVVGGQATFTTTYLPMGTSLLQAAYSGDSNNQGSVLALGPTIEVAAGSTEVTAPTLEVDTIRFEPLSEATVGCQTRMYIYPTENLFVGDLTGGCSVFDGERLIASFMGAYDMKYLPSMSLGTHSLKVVYSGDANRPATTRTIELVVGKSPTDVQVTTSSKIANFPSLQTVIGVPLTLTANISPDESWVSFSGGNFDGPPASGLVTFYGGNSVIGTASVVNGVATLIVSDLPLGTYPITASYSGDSSYQGEVGGGPIQQVVASTQVAQTQTTLTAAPLAGGNGTATTLIAKVSTSAGALPSPVGTVSFYRNFSSLETQLLGTVELVNGMASLDVSQMPYGSSELTAVYSGDIGNATSTAYINQSVKPASTTTTLEASAENVTQGDPVTLTAQVAGAMPGGLVTFFAGTEFLGTALVIDGQATFTTAYLPVGTSVLQAAYVGDENNVGSALSVGPTIHVVAGSSEVAAPVVEVDTIHLEPSSEVMVGFPTQAWILLSNSYPSDGDYEGSFSIFDGATLISSFMGSYDSQKKIPPMSLGTHFLRVVYSGDASRPAASRTVEVVVGQAPVEVSVKSSSPKTVAGVPLDLVANISPRNPWFPGAFDGPFASGTVTFYSDDIAIGTASVIDGVATLSVSDLPIGAHIITASYSGDVNYKSIDGAVYYPLYQQVVTDPVVTIVSLNVLPVQPVYGSTATLSAKVFGEAAQEGGVVSFYDGATLLATVDLVNGAAVLSVSNLDVGSHTIRAVYSGDANNSGSTSTSDLVIARSPIVLKNLSATPVDQTGSLSIQVEGPEPGGLVSFYNGSNFLGTADIVNGVANLAGVSLPPGTHTFTAAYAGNAYNEDGEISFTQVVEGAPVTTVYATLDIQQDRTVTDLYNRDGQLQGTLDAEGYLTEYKYNAAGELTQTVRYANRAANFSSVSARIAAIAIARASYNLSGLRPGINSADINSYNFYDAQGRVVGQVDGEGYLTETVYDTRDHVTQSIRYANKAGAVGSASTLASIRPALNASQDQKILQSWDNAGQLISRTNAEGTVTQFSYNSVGQLVQTITAAGTADERTNRARYDIQGRLVGELDGRGSDAVALNDPLALWAANGVTHTYDEAGRRTSTTDANGHRTLFFYDPIGRLRYTVNALGEVTESKYNALGQLHEQIVYGTPVDVATLGGTTPGGLNTSILTSQLEALADASKDTHVLHTYNATGTMASTTDALGSATSYSYNAFREAIASSYALKSGYVVTDTASYDRRGLKVKGVSDAGTLAITTRQSYDAFGRVYESFDGNNNRGQIGYDRLGRIVTSVDALNGSRTTTYDAFDRVLTQRDALLNTTSYSYNQTNRSVTVTTPEGVAVTTVRTRQGQTQSVTDGRGNTTSYSYDKSGNLTGSTAPLSVTSAATYDKTGLRLTSTDANGVVTNYTYDAVNRLLTRTLDPTGLNLTTAYAYDAKGQTISVTDPRGIVTTTEFDLAGQTVRQVVDPLGLNLATRYTHDTTGQVLTVTDPKGNVTAYTYDGAGRRIKEQVDPAGLNLTRSYEYDAAGNVTRSIDGNNNATRYAYDANNRLVYTLDALGNLSKVEYDAEGRVVRRTTYASPISTTGLSNAPTVAQLQAKVVPSAGSDIVESRRYDRDGRLRFSVDGTGAVVEYKYDKANNVIEKRAYANRINLTSWSIASDPPVTADPVRDERVRTVYDALNRAAWKMDGAGGVTHYAYDSNGNVINTQAYATALTSAAFDSWSGTSAPSVLTDQARDQRIRTVYDAANRATWSVDALGNATEFTYDADGNVVTKRSYAAPLTAAALAAWIGNTAPAAVADDAHDLRVRNVYDAANRLTWSVDGVGAVSKTEYDANGNVTRLIQYATPIAQGADPASAATSNADRITEWVYDGANRKAFQLDRIDRVTSPSLSVAEGSGPMRALQGWRYDGNGNVTSHTRYIFPVLSVGPLTYEALANPVTSVDDQTTRMAYDASGRLSYQVDGTGAVTGFAYDGTGCLTRQVQYANRITNAALPGSVVISATDRITAYAHDGAGRRTFTVDALGGVTRAIYDAFGNVTQQVDYLNPLEAPDRFTVYTDDQMQGLVNFTFTDSLQPDQVLGSNQSIVSVDGRYQLVFQDDGNLVIYDRQQNRLPVWSSETSGSGGDRFIFQTDGNLVIYAGSQPIWNSNTFDQTAQRLIMQPDGNLVLYSAQWTAIWETGTSAAASLNVGSGDRVQHFAYDQANRQVFVVDAQGGTTESVYDGLGQTTESRQYAKAISATGLSTTASVSDIRARTTVDAANDRITRQLFDAAGRVIYGVDALGFVTKTDYDGLDQVKGSLQYALSIPLGTANTAAAIAAAVVLSPDDRSKSFAHDAAGRVLSADTMGLTESWTYDVLGNKTSYTNAKQAVWTYAYDRSGRMVQETSPQVDLTAVTPGADGRLQVDAAHSGPGSVITRLEYDPFGNLYRRTEAVGRPEERSTAYVYDQVGRQIKVIYPPVGVYTPSGDTFAVDGLDTRHDTIQTLYTETTYDALGNAIANRDIGGNRSYKTYDLVGRVAYEVDALGFATGYQRNTFGDATILTRYSASTGLTAANPASLSTRQLQITVNTQDANNRKILTDYDRLGRAIQIKEPTVSVYDSSQTTGTPYMEGGKTTRNTYNTFGELTQVAQQKDASTWTLSTNFYDRRGKQTASVDALGYLTTQNFDMAGNVTMRIEYAKAVTWTGTSNLAGWTGAVNAGGTPPTPTNLDVKNDRRVDTVYDRYNRKISETRKNVEYSEASNGISTRGDLTTSYGYDAVGNLTSTTDAKGAVTYSYYDALGRVTAVAEPTRTSTETGAAITPLTVFRRDAHGNVVLKTEYVNGADANGNPLSPNPTPSIVSIPNPEVALLEGMFFLGNPAAPMWGKESTIGYIASAPFAGSKLLYRGVNTVLNKHYFTTDEAEWQSWLTIPAFQAEAPVGYVATAAQPGTTKLYRLQATDGSTDIIFTTSLDEANALASGSLGRPYALQNDEIYVSTSAQGPFDSKLTRYFSAYNVAPITWGLDHLYVTETIQAALDPVRDADLIARTDRTSFAQYDALGHTVQSTDAMGVNHYSSYNNQGLIAKEWQGVTDNAGATRTLFRAYQYDALGQQTHVLDPGTASDNAVYTDGGVSQGNGYVLNPKAELTPGAYGPKFGQVIYENDNSSDGTHGDVPVGVDMTMDPGKLTLSLAQLTNLLDVATAAGFRVEIDYITPDRPPVGLAGTTGTSEPGVPAHLVTYSQDFTDLSLVGTTASVDLVPGNSQGPIGSVQQIRIYQLGIVFPFPVPISEPTPRWQGTLAQADGQRGLSSGPGASGTVVDSAMQYNAFGELVAKSVNGQAGEYFDYDKAGRLWRTNAGDGVDKIALYDLQGRQTADIRSAGTGRGDINLRSAANAAQVAQLSDVRRTDTKYDLLGRVVETTLPERQELQGGVSVRTDALVGGIAARAVHGDGGWSGTNTVNLGWNVLGGLGSGEVSVKLYYIPVDAQGNEGPEQVKTKFLNATEGNGGASFSWNPTADEAYGGIGRISRVEVAKKDLQASWQTLISQNGVGYVGQSLQVDSPDDPNASVQVQYRVAGSNGAWNELTIVRFGDSARGDLSGLAMGSYEYQVTTHAPGQPDRPTSAGTFDITPRPLTTFGVAGVNGSTQTLEWQGPGAGDLQTIRVRAVGGAWSGPWDITRAAGSDWSTINISGFGAGQYEYEILWTHPGEAGPYAHATGQINKVAGVPGTPGTPGTPDVVVPPSPPAISGLEVVTALLYGGGVQIPAVKVPLPDPSIPHGFVYRVKGSDGPMLWSLNIIQDSNNYEFGYADLSQVPPGTYEFIYYQGFATAPLAWATGDLYYLTGMFEPYSQIVSTTPPEAPGYTIPGTPGTPGTPDTPPQYGWTATDTGPYPISQNPLLGGRAIGQNAGQNSADRNLRPKVLQNVDRWGNVVGITDPRSTSWKTTYSYNANNQMVLQVQTDEDGNPGADANGNIINPEAPVTRLYYDAMGRQVAVRDANDHVNGQEWDAGGNLVRELHADSGVISYAYDAFGNKVRTIDAENRTTSLLHDKLDRLVRTNRGAGVEAIVERQSWDEAGRKLSQTNGAGNQIKYDYDLRSNLIRTTQPLGQATQSAYDALNHKILEMDANGSVAAWRYDYFGQLKGRTDIGKASYTYAYDNARQLLTQTNSRGQHLDYGYDAAGQLVQIVDSGQRQPDDGAGVKVSSYAYDLSGRRTRETTVQDGVTYQDNRIAYDALGRMRWVADTAAYVNIEYDKVGNRTYVGVHVNDGANRVGEDGHLIEKHYAYDEMNRQTMVDAQKSDDGIWTLGAEGHRLTYYKDGTRKSDTHESGQRVLQVNGQWTPVLNEVGETQEVYTYDSLGRLKTNTRDGATIDTRTYDGADRVLMSGIMLGVGGVDGDYINAHNLINGGPLPADLAGGPLRGDINTYDDNGRLTKQISNSVGVTPVHSETTYKYDDMGNMTLSETSTLQAGIGLAPSSAQRAKLVRAEGYEVSMRETGAAGQLPGLLGYGYDANGHLVRTSDARDQLLPQHRFVNDAQGNALYAYYTSATDPNTPYNGQRQLVVNGEVLGRYGQTIDQRFPLGNPFLPGADMMKSEVSFSFGYQPIDGSYPAGSPGVYAVQTNDTLQSIAKGAYGDGNLWYLIADANGLMSNADLRTGQVLTIPTRVTGANNVNTFQPYDPSKIANDTPTMLARPQDEKGCGGVGQIIVAVVSIVVAAYTGVYLGVESIAGAAAAGAAGSVAGQAVGIAIGAQDSFSWKSVALGALGGAISAGIGASDFIGAVKDVAGPVAGRIVAQTLSNAATQGIAVVTGLQDKFNWKSVAASAVSAGVSQGLNEAMNYNPGATGFEWDKSLVSGVGGSLVGQVVRGGKVSAATLASDAFGNVIGDSLAWDSSANNPSSRNYMNQMDRASYLSESDPLGGLITRYGGWRGVGNALGDSLASANGQSSSARPFGETDAEAWGRVPAGAGYGYQGSGNGITNWQANVALATSSGTTISDTWTPSSMAQQYADTFGGETSLTAGRSGVAVQASRFDPPTEVQQWALSNRYGPLTDAAARQKAQSVGNAIASIFEDDAATPDAGTFGISQDEYDAMGGSISASLGGAVAGTAVSLGKMAYGSLRTASNAFNKVLDVATGGVLRDTQWMQQSLAENAALGNGIINAVSSPRETTVGLMENVANRYNNAMSLGDSFQQSYALSNLFSDVSQGALGLAYGGRNLARLGATELRGFGIADWNIRLSSPNTLYTGGVGIELERIGSAPWSFTPFRNSLATLDLSMDSYVMGDSKFISMKSNQFFLRDGTPVKMTRENPNGANQMFDGYFTPSTGDLHVSWMSTANRGMNFGTEMLSRAIEEAGPSNVKSISANLGADNLAAYNKNLGLGMSPLEAAQNTPAAKIRAKLGFGEIHYDAASNKIIGYRAQ
ncbi:YD repeat-containing protein [Variovorax boronicumulans]|uniref:Ig-like domain repeat protein n=1 Tax=Variovorax boronicumulans TaxID=436515 RepID=UPI002787D286|nr:Ig-like domain repeat protein [Variovorax boronicumulans]MDP9912417.1 YD repeat-containing protein [Variovorax boronicumulans]